jgi:FtsP/CotA-like multicopper oxidase with cupredoxin domain
VPSGSSAHYAFVATTDGTYWYHSHQNSLAQLDRGLYGVIIIAPRTQPSAPGTDATLVFDEWPLGLERPSPPPASDFSMISYVTYTVNTKTGSAIAPVRFEPGKLVRLRLLNVGAFDHFVHIDGQAVTIVAFDGHTVRGGPPTTDTLPLGPAERLDVEFTGPDTALWIHLQDGIPPAADVVVPLLPLGTAVPPIPAISSPAKVLDIFDYPAHAVDTVWPANTVPNKTFTLRLSAELAPGGVQAMSPDETLYEINGAVFPATGTLEVGLGDFVEITFANDSSVDHPMHMHGMSFQIITLNGLRPAGVLVKDTVVVAPKARVTIGFKADNPGWWMLHCHVLYHSLGGMMILVHVGGAPRLAQLGGPFGGSPD